MIYEGKIKKVTHDKGNWKRVLFIEKGSTDTIVAVGNIPGAADGLCASLHGEKIIDPNWGEQIKVESAVIETSKDKDGIIAYLTSGFIKGVGPVMAEKIYNKFGMKTMDIINKEPERLLEISGISKKKLDKIIESHESNNIYTELYKILGGQVTAYQANRIIEFYGKKSVEIIKQNPYTLIYDLDGFGFVKADKIAKACGFTDLAPERIGAAIIFILQNLANSKGHCFSSTEAIEDEGIELLNPIPAHIAELNSRRINLFKAAIRESADVWEDVKDDFYKKWKITDENCDIFNEWMETRNQLLDVFAASILDEVDKGHLILDEDPVDGIRIYWKKLYDAEQNVAHILSKLLTQKSIKNIPSNIISKKIDEVEAEQGYDLGSEQKDAIRMGVKNKMCIITGGPGRGKTTIIKTIADIWNDDHAIILCAPTGRASQRMKESTGRNAETIHRTILHDPPENKLIICDESSMLDIQIASKFLSWATKYDNNIIFVGDVDQLPSVGPGAFFRDLIECKLIPTVKLETCYRNSGSIAINAERINKGKSMKNLQIDSNFVFIEKEKAIIQNEILKQYEEMRKTYIEKDICVLSPTKNSSSGVKQLNDAIRNTYNPYDAKKPQLKDCDFRIGDRVMQTKNNAKKEVEKDGLIQYGVFNGDCGKIIDLDLDEGLYKIEFDDGRIAYFDKIEMSTFILAYAMTIHKSQGSEYPVVILICNYQHYTMLKRNLLYTGETRAKEKVILIGEKRAVNAAIRDNEQILRNTRLKQILRQLISK